MIADLKPDESVAIQENSDDVNLRFSYDVNSARNMYASYAVSCLKSVYCRLRGWAAFVKDGDYQIGSYSNPYLRLHGMPNHLSACSSVVSSR